MFYFTCQRKHKSNKLQGKMNLTVCFLFLLFFLCVFLFQIKTNTAIEITVRFQEKRLFTFHKLLKIGLTNAKPWCHFIAIVIRNWRDPTCK